MDQKRIQYLELNFKWVTNLKILFRNSSIHALFYISFDLRCILWDPYFTKAIPFNKRLWQNDCLCRHPIWFLGDQTTNFPKVSMKTGVDGLHWKKNGFSGLILIITSHWHDLKIYKTTVLSCVVASVAGFNGGAFTWFSLWRKRKGTLGNYPGANINKRNSLTIHPIFKQMPKQTFPKRQDNIEHCYYVWNSYKGENGIFTKNSEPNFVGYRFLSISYERTKK